MDAAMTGLFHSHRWRLPVGRYLTRRGAIAAVAVVMSFQVADRSHAQFMWDGGGTTNNWSEDANWGTFVPPSGGSATVDLQFALGSTNFMPVNDLGTFNLQTLTMAGSSNTYTLSGDTLRFANSASLISMFGGSHVIENNIELPQPLEVSVGGTQHLDGNLSGTANVTKSGGGTLVLDGSNGGWSGDLNIDDGTVRLGPGDALSLNSDLHVAQGATADFSPEGEGFGGFSGDGHLEFGNTVDIFSHFAADRSFAGTVSGANVHLRKQGPATLSLSAGADVAVDQITIQDGQISVTDGAIVTTSGNTIVELGTTLALAAGSDFNSGGSLLVRGTLSTSGGGISLLFSFRSITVQQFGIWNLDDLGDTHTTFTQATLNINDSGLLRMFGDVTLDGSFLNIEDTDLIEFANTGVEIVARNNSSLNIGPLTGVEDSNIVEIHSNAEITLNTGSDLRTNRLRIGVDDGGIVRADGSGTLIDAAYGIDVGFDVAGELHLSGGARAESSRGTVGGSPGGSGLVTIAGTDAMGNPSAWEVSVLDVGHNDDTYGEVRIEAGGQLSVSDLDIGNFGLIGGAGSVTVDGADMAGNPSLLSVSSLSLIAHHSDDEATLTVTNGARAEVDDHVDLRAAPGMAMLTVSGAGSVFQQTGAHQFLVGSNDGSPSPCIVHIDGGTLATGAGGSIVVGNGGAIRVTSGTFRANGPMSISSGGEVILDGQPNGGGALEAISIDVADGGAFTFHRGQLSVEGFQDDLINESGTLAPGTPIGQTLIQGDYTQQQNGILEVEIGGQTPVADHDLVGVTGNVILDGALQLALVDFVPDPSDTFTILNSTNILGTFTNVLTGQRLETVDQLGSFLVHYGAGSSFASNQIVLSDFQPAATLPGDYNFDGAVDAADYVMWRKNPANHGGDPAGYNIWRANFGQSFGAGSVTALASDAPSVPEPLTFGLALIAAAILCPVRRLWQ